MSPKATKEQPSDASTAPPSSAGAPQALWRDLSAHGARLETTRTEALFADDPGRFGAFSARHEDLLLDFSKEKIDRPALDALLRLLAGADLPLWRARMAAGEIVNGTERRAARHMILRAPHPPLAGVAEMREEFLDFAEAVRDGAIRGASGERFTDVVNIGIGGSYLGPRLAVEALAAAADGPRIHFAANVDPWDLQSILGALDPARTLLLCASKSFATQETVLNMRAAIDWISTKLGPHAVGEHVCAITARPDRARRYGIQDRRIFQIWNWAGGRFSVWSSMGLCAAIRIGRANFEAFLEGGADMDRHFQDAPAPRNLPILLALVGVWRRNVEGRSAYVISPYEQRLAFFGEYIQQLEMESNGKTAARDGAAAAHATAPFVFGGAGTNTQHSFFQTLHQGYDPAPVDFLVGVETPTAGAHAQNVLLSHCLAQSKAMMTGLSAEAARAQLLDAGESEERAAALAAHLACPGDRPSTTLMYRRLDPATLGRLIALYEHKVFVQAVIWGIECFDQWGVELGKRLADDLIPRLDAPDAWRDEDPSTRGLLEWRRTLRGRR